MRRIWMIAFCVCIGYVAQAQRVAVKTNLLNDALTTPNLGVEVAFSQHISAEVSGSYNPWTLGGGKSLQHWAVQPEVRYWLHDRFNGHYLGVHALYMDYRFAGVGLPFGMKKAYSYEGDAYGGGISYGYQLYLTPHWNVEFTVGGGFIGFTYDKFSFPEHDNKGLFQNHYWGITKAGISLVYIIK